MAMTEEGQAAFAAQRENLLDVVLDKLQKANKTTIYSRIIYVARLNRRENSIDAIQEFHRKAIEKHMGEVSGLLLAYPSVLVHVLEASTTALLEIISTIASAPAEESKIAEARDPCSMGTEPLRPLHGPCKVISSTEDIPSRCFNQWHTAFLNSSSSADKADAYSGAAVVKTAVDISGFLRSVGSELEGQPEPEVRRRLESLDAYVQSVPAPEVLLSMVPADDAPTLKEFLDIFDGPINVDFDSERVWPMPMPLQF